MKQRVTFIADIGYGEHLHVVLSYPYGIDEDRLVVVTMVSTYDESYKNSACILYPTDGHPFITRRS
jgi:hypothetical protein